MDKPVLLIDRIRHEQYPMNLLVFEILPLLKDFTEVQDFFGNHPNIEDVTYLAYVEQFQIYDLSFRGVGHSDTRHNLREGDEFICVYPNKPLILKNGKVESSDLAHRIQLDSPIIPATRIRDFKHGYFVSDESGTIGDSLLRFFLRAMTEWKGYMNWDWKANYPHVSIATVNSPNFTDEIIAAGNKIGARIHVYKT